VRFDLLILADPLWETTRLVEAPPMEGRSRAPADDGGNDLTGRPGEPGFAAGDTAEVCRDGGGSALNTACAMARAGWQVLVLGQVGEDAAGRDAIAALRRHGVTTLVESSPGRRTPRIEVLVDRKTGENAFRVQVDAGWDSPAAPARGPAAAEERALEARVLLTDRLSAEVAAVMRRRDRLGGGRLNALSLVGARFTAETLVRFQQALETLHVLQLPEDPSPASDAPDGAPGGRRQARSPAPKKARQPIVISAEAAKRGGGDDGVDRADRDDGIDRDDGEDRHDAEGGDDGGGAIGAPIFSRLVAGGPSRPFDPRSTHRPRPFPHLSPQEIEHILSRGVEHLILTRGAGGVRVHIGMASAAAQAGPTAPGGRRSFEFAALPVTVLDPTGAGDALTAGYLTGLLEGRSPEAAIRLGLDWAARACRHLGARTWLDREPPGRHARSPRGQPA